MVSQYKKNGINAKLLYHYFDERLLNYNKKQNETLLPVTFLGSSGIGYGLGHASRYSFLKTLLKKTSIVMWLQEGDDDTNDSLFKTYFLNKIKKRFLNYLLSLPYIYHYQY